MTPGFWKRSAFQGRVKIDIHLVSFNASSYFSSKRIRSAAFTVEKTIPTNIRIRIKDYYFTGAGFFLFKSLTSHKQDKGNEMRDIHVSDRFPNTSAAYTLPTAGGATGALVDL